MPLSAPLNLVQIPDASRVTLRSRSFDMLLGRLDDTRRHDVLDLGAPLGANVAFFGQYRCRLHVADAFRTLAERPAPPAGGSAPPAGGSAPPAGGSAPPAGGSAPPAGGSAPPAGGSAPLAGEEALPADHAALFPFAADTRFDVVLAWDVFSYLPPAEVSELVRYVGGFCAPGALLHALVFTGEHLPSEPAAVRIHGSRELDYAPAGPAVLRNPRPSPIAFERMVPGFRMLHSFLLGGGLQDYLLTFE